MNVFENRFLRRTFRHEAGKVREGWRKLPENELYNLYTSPRVVG
jgi:hypothetical protein